MSVMSLILTCTVLWIVTIFIALPIGITVPKDNKTGHADSAPAKHYLGYKLVATFVVSIILTAVHWYCMR